MFKTINANAIISPYTLFFHFKFSLLLSLIESVLANFANRWTVFFNITFTTSEISCIKSTLAV